MTKIILKPGKDQSPRRYHPWIFSGAIKKIYWRSCVRAMLSLFMTANDELLGYGHYQPGSIAVRLLAFGDEYPRRSVFQEKAERGFKLQKSGGTFLL